MVLLKALGGEYDTRLAIVDDNDDDDADDADDDDDDDFSVGP